MLYKMLTNLIFQNILSKNIMPTLVYMGGMPLKLLPVNPYFRLLILFLGHAFQFYPYLWWYKYFKFVFGVSLKIVY